MCGIAGIIDFKTEQIDSTLLKQMGDAIAHRGPDDSGIETNHHMGVVHRRLSIIDVSQAAHQPMQRRNRYTLVYNGEIYNYTDFILELAHKGYAFYSSSDTEVLLYLYMEYGAAMLQRLNGMFAFAIWDNVKQELFVARDRMGVKPLYYHYTQHHFYFASEIKSIFAAGIRAEINENQIPEWLFYRYIAGEQTLYKGIYQLLPGHYAIVSSQGGLITKRWYRLDESIRNHSTIHRPIQWFRETFDASVKLRMVSDVPVGVLLSGGLDSTSVATSLHQSGYQNIHSFNIGFRNYRNDESTIAKQFSESINFPFHSVYASGNDLAGLVKQSIYQLDGPLVHLNDPQLLSVSLYAKQHVKVLLSGEGSDELMGGYVRYKTFKYIRFRTLLKTLIQFIPEKYTNNRIEKLKRYLHHQSINQLIAGNASNYFESDFSQLGIQHFGITNPYRAQVLHEARKLYPTNVVRQLLYYDQHTYLQSLNERNDRATMGASIECREPFQDYHLVEGLGTLSTDWLLKGKKGKHILVSAMKQDLPDYILNHRKIGLSVPWMQLIKGSEELWDEWNNFIQNPMFENELLNSLNIKPYLKKVDEHQSHLYDQLILQLFMFHLWKRTYFSHFQ